MNPHAAHLWKAPAWALSLLIACLGMLGPFSIDTYLPAFAGIRDSLGATPLEMQQTLSAYLFAFAAMNLFHGALADSFGRRPVILAGVALFTLASVGCALAQTIGQLVFFRAVQGLSTGAGIVVSRALIRDLFTPAQAQRVMSQVMLFFGIAPAIAPLIGGLLYEHVGWRAVFWLLAGIGLALAIANWRALPETLPAHHAQPFNLRNLFRGYARLVAHRDFMLLAVANGVPFNAMFLYVLSAPAFLGERLGLAPTQFFWFFCVSIAGIVGGSWLSGRLAGRITPRRQIRHGFTIMAVASIVNVVANANFTAQPWWALPLIGSMGFGWSLLAPAVMLLLLDLVPERRGLASSLQAVVGSAANGIVAGALAPMVMHATLDLALASFGLMGFGLVSWQIVKRRVRAA